MGWKKILKIVLVGVPNLNAGIKGSITGRGNWLHLFQSEKDECFRPQGIKVGDKGNINSPVLQ